MFGYTEHSAIPPPTTVLFPHSQSARVTANEGEYEWGIIKLDT